jgi:hypothetical protein
MKHGKRGELEWCSEDRRVFFDEKQGTRRPAVDSREEGDD